MNKSDYVGTFEDRNYTEAHTPLRLVLHCTTEDLDSAGWQWAVQGQDDTFGWYDMSTSPNRRTMSFDRALHEGRIEAGLLVRRIAKSEGK